MGILLAHPAHFAGLLAMPDGCLLWTETTGDGPPVALCHGGPGLWDRYALSYPDRVTALIYLCRRGLDWNAYGPVASAPSVTAGPATSRTASATWRQCTDADQEHEFLTLSWATDFADHAVGWPPQAMSVLRSAQASARAEGMAEVDTGHVLRALVTHGRIAIEVLTVLDITAQQVRVGLDKRVTPAPASRGGATTEPTVSRQVALAIELAANESSGLGNGYVGSEHLLLGLIGEPDGAAGKVLRALGAELRVTRRAVAATLAGWKAGFSAHEERTAEVSPSPVAAGQLSAAIKAELEPLLARLEQLERRAAS